MASSTTSDAITPPTTEMVARSSTDTSPSTPKTLVIAVAITASRRASTKVSAIEAATLSPRTVRRRSDNRKSPACTDVLMRLPSAENTLPLMPTAAGTMTSSPG